MGFFFPRFRAFGIAVFCTFALFAIAAWIPNDAIDFVAWLIAVFLGLPVSVLTYRDTVRSAASTGRLVSATLTFSLRLFGALSMFIGVGILGWQAYNLFVRRLPEITGLKAIAQALLPIALIGFGYRMLRRPLHAEHADDEAA